MVWGPPRGYFLDSTKSILVLFMHNLAPEERFFRGKGLAIVTGSRYLGGYIGDVTPQKKWLGKKVQYWTGGIHTMAGVVYKHPQTSYASL